MTPDYSILCDTKEITDKINDRMISLSVVDEAGLKSDTLTLVLDNRDGKVAIPPTGAKLEAWMGYKETGLARMGLYVADEITISGPPDKLTISANSANMRDSLKEKKERSWDRFSLGDLVATIAAEHGYLSKVDPSLENIRRNHLDQTESDMHLLTRLAKEYAAVAKFAGKMILFVPERNAKSASGKKISPVTLTRGELERWSVRSTDRKHYKSVAAWWQDVKSGEKKKVVAGKGSPQHSLSVVHPNEAMAKDAAMAMMKTLSRGKASLDFSCVGRPDIMAETPLTLENVAQGADGDWVVSRATHEISSSGYRLSGSATPPEASTPPAG
ncbi:MAG: hypothetical protein MI742_05900 [Desulfobacterales bacterium]|nr:hypothetical protein [Desulfobacterales bacterium]